MKDLDPQTRPLVTFIIFAYNQERYIREAVEGAFAQTYDPLEIILSDDCSVDTTFDIMKQMATEYRGPHKIVLNRNERNLGIGGHVNHVLELAAAQYIVLAAGDDISLSTRTVNSMQYLSSSPDIVMISTSILEFGDDGRPEKVGGSPCLQEITASDYFGSKMRHPPGCSRAFRREVFDKFGSLIADCPTEDTPLLLRGALLGRFLVVPDIGVRYRRHDGGVSQGLSAAQFNLSVIGHQYMSDLKIALSNGLLSQEEFNSLSKLIKRYLARREALALARTGSLSVSRLFRYIVGANGSLRDRLYLLKTWKMGLN